MFDLVNHEKQTRGLFDAIKIQSWTGFF